jgi:hypothetical protein
MERDAARIGEVEVGLVTNEPPEVLVGFHNGLCVKRET